MEDIEYYDIPVYNFPYDVEEDDEDTIADNSELRVSLHQFNSLGITLTQSHSRPSFPLLLWGQKTRWRLTASSFAVVCTHGALSRLTTPSTPISAVYGVPCSSKCRNQFLLLILA